jgi:acyl-CoA reductase-like NAD-dependent aldehyde dehydrogenase
VQLEFIEKFIQKAEGLKVGDPLSDDTDVGPLVNANRLKKFLTGVEQVERKGSTVLKNVTAKMRIAQEEVFGPVAPIIVAADEVEVMKFANDSDYGLGASI